MEAHLELYLIFGFFILSFMILDLGYFNRKSHKIEFKPALYQSIFWITVAMFFNFLIWKLLGKEPAVEFLSAYVTEKALSVDNLFLILLVFKYFKLDEQYHHKVLFWGIMGAIIFRGIFIAAGALIINKFHWILYIFGAILIYTGYHLLTKKDDHSNDLENNKIVQLTKKYLPFSKQPHEGRFIIKENGKWHFTSLFLVMLIVEEVDIMFAIDSIPAVFAISQDPFIVFTSNIFAIMGLRSLFFLVENILNRFRYLQKGLSFILLFIGAKMLSGIVGIHVSSVVSLMVILSILSISIIFSVLATRKEAKLQN